MKRQSPGWRVQRLGHTDHWWDGPLTFIAWAAMVVGGLLLTKVSPLALVGVACLVCLVAGYQIGRRR